MQNRTRFFKTNEDPEPCWIWNGHPVRILGGTEVEINDKKFYITRGIRKVIVDSSYNSAKSINDMNKVVFSDRLQKTNNFIRIPTKTRISSCDRYIKNNFIMMLEEF